MLDWIANNAGSLVVASVVIGLCIGLGKAFMHIF